MCVLLSSTETATPVDVRHGGGGGERKPALETGSSLGFQRLHPRKPLSLPDKTNHKS